MSTFGNTFDTILLDSTGGSSIGKAKLVQELWSGYGKIVRVGLTGHSSASVIVKHVQIPNDTRHPRGWNTNLSHDRKLKSYQVESNWYKNWSKQCTDLCRVPDCYVVEISDGEIFLVLEDLNESGFPVRHSNVEIPRIENCLKWLAHFHAIFMGASPSGLWQSGTYWHLETRPDELDALDDIRLKSAAHTIDKKLKSAKYQTLVHGDAKLANFCFSDLNNKVSAVDFQYVGGGCGMKDVAYFIGSCLDETECEIQETHLLDSYFNSLSEALTLHHPELKSKQVINEWRDLYPFAWADFHRFLKGWCPGHWKINGYSEQITREVLDSFSEFGN